MVALDDVPRGPELNFSLDAALRIKREARASRAAKPVAEKLRTLERLRDRARTIRAARIPSTTIDPRDVRAPK